MLVCGRSLFLNQTEKRIGLHHNYEVLLSEYISVICVILTDVPSPIDKSGFVGTANDEMLMKLHKA